MTMRNAYTESEHIEKTRNHTRGDWAKSFMYLIILTVYVALIWARLGELLPPPYDGWTFIYEPFIGQWWIENYFLDKPVWMRLTILWYIICFVFSMLLPFIFFKLRGRKLTDFGIGMLNTLGIRLTSIAIIVSIPFGLWIQLASPYPHKLSVMYILSLFNKVPEHFLICGVLTAFLLPLRRLPNPVYLAPIEGGTGRKVLRWLGLSQPRTSDSDSKTAAWFGLNWTTLFAVTASGLVFFMIHIGRDNSVEVWLSLPGGITIAYITLRTHSIWHAIPAHWTLNLVPMGIIYLWDKY